MSKQQPDQEINIYQLPEGTGRQQININAPAPPPPHFAAGTSHLVLLLIVGAFLVIIACGVATALTAGAVF